MNVFICKNWFMVDFMNKKDEKSENEEISEYYAIQSQIMIPYLPTPSKLIRKVLQSLNFKESAKLYDLGAGDGRVIVMAAEEFGFDSVGYEINKTLYKQALKLIAELPEDIQNKTKMIHGDMFSVNCSDANILFFYITPKSHRYLNHIISQCEKGTNIVFIRFQPSREFCRELQLQLVKKIEDKKQELNKATAAYIYVIKRVKFESN
ncbi:MAG: hypothetical protein GF364_10785 [Candidatus Lokiarchaeota archaeon]|nr:hypothetical protein [Candidatus Lokiarchaeota archaeon]